MNLSLSFILSAFIAVSGFTVQAAQLNFDKVPKNQLVGCRGQDGVATSPTGLEIVVMPLGFRKGESRKAAYVMLDQSELPYNMPVFSEVIGSKQLANATELYAFFKSYLSGLLTDGSIAAMAQSPAAYPLSVVVGKKVYTPEGSTKSDGQFLWAAVSGLKVKDENEKDMEGTFVFLTYRPKAGSNEKPELLSGGMTTCELLDVVDKK